MSWCRPECASALMGICGWEGEGNRSILPRKIVAKTGGRWWTVLPQNGFIFQQDDSPAYSARVTEDWLKLNCSDFITKDKCRPIHPISIQWITTKMLGSYHKLQPNIPELKDALQLIWSAQKSIDNAAVEDCRKRLVYRPVPWWTFWT